GVCSPACTLDADCASNHCLNGSCVACVAEADCIDTTMTCSQNQFVPKCASARDCKACEDCQGSVCVHVGCRTDRECLVSQSGSDPGPGFFDMASQPTHRRAH